MSSIPDMFNLGGKVAVITGGAVGLGLEIGQVLSEAGASIVCSDINPATIGAAVESIAALGSPALGVECDVADEGQVARLVEQAMARFGKIDILVNNAGIADPEPSRLHEYRTANWRRVLDIDLDGVFYCSREVLKVMLPRGGGKIINVASMWGLAGASSVFPIPAYNAAKGAVVNLTREMALEYASDNIQVNALCPGFYRTRLAGGAYDNPDFVAAVTAFTPMGRVAEAEEIRGPALFLASSASDYVTGTTLVADGGCMAK